MAYAALTDLEFAAGGAERLRQLTDVDGSGTPKGAAVAAVIAEAAAWVDKSIQLRYSVPLTEPIPSLIRFMVAREAVYLLKLARDMITEADLAAHEERGKTLDAIRTGELALGVDPIPTKSSYVVDRTVSPAITVAVSRDALKGFS